MITKPNENFNVSLVSFPKQTVEIASNKERAKKYPISKVARILNRSVSQTNYKPYEWSNRGKIVSEQESRFIEVHRSHGALITLTHQDKQVSFSSVLLARSPKMLKEIDSLFNKFVKKIDSSEVKNRDLVVKRFAVFICLLYGALHPFPDANGRTSIGLLDFILRAYSSKGKGSIGLNYEKVSNNPNHSTYMSLVGFSLASEPFSIEDYFSKIKNGNLNVDLANEIIDSGKLSSFLRGCLKNLSYIISKFDIESGNLVLKKDDFPNASWFVLAYNEFFNLINESLIRK